MTIKPYDPDKIKFLILGLGFFYGVYLLPAGHYSINRIPYKIGKLTGVFPSGKDIPKALVALSNFYDLNPKKRNNMFAVLHWMLVGQTLNHSWERFEAQYKVLDGLFKISGATAKFHSDRPVALGKKYSIQLPEWAKINGKHSKLSTLRNQLFHEALYVDKPIGYAHPAEDYDIEFVTFNSKIIAATLGLASNFQKNGSSVRYKCAWEIE